MIEKLPGYFKDPHTMAHAQAEEPILVALSGGSDSSALLYLLSELRKKKDFPLYAAHVNHNIRTENYNGEAERDERFCRKLCQNISVELFVHSADVPAKAVAEGKSIETAARDERYAFFADVMRQKNIRILATAHNADDNFETQLFNLCRGCGIEGICGIPEVRPVEGVEDGVAVRPILGATKREIINFCTEHQIDFVTDSTNFEDDCVRNKLRLNVIPRLKEIFNSPERCGMRLSLSASEDNAFINEIAQNELFDSDNRLKLSSLVSAHPSVAKRMLSIAYKRFSGHSLESSHINILLDFAREEKNGAISLPSFVTASFCDGYLSFEKGEPQKTDAVSYRMALHEGFNIIEGTPFAISVAKNADECVANEEYEPYATARISDGFGNLFAANRREGDVIMSGKMHKRIKKLMCDKKIPLTDRDALPLICSEEEILFVPGCAVADIATSKSKNGYFTVSVYKIK